MGDPQGLHVVGTQSTVVAVGDTISATDLLQDEGAGGNGFTVPTVAQVLGAVKLGRKQNDSKSAAGSWETDCLSSHRKIRVDISLVSHYK